MGGGSPPQSRPGLTRRLIRPGVTAPQATSPPHDRLRFAPPPACATLGAPCSAPQLSGQSVGRTAGSVVPELYLPTTAGFVLTSLQPDDGAALAAWLGDGEVASFIPVIPQPYGLAEGDAWVRHRTAFRERHGREISFAVRNAKGELVGSMGFDDFSVGPADTAELGGWLAPTVRGQGLAQECGRALVRYGFETLRLNRISARTLATNGPSIRLATRLGFQEMDDLQAHTRVHARLHDVLLFGLTKIDWCQSASS